MGGNLVKTEWVRENSKRGIKHTQISRGILFFLSGEEFRGFVQQGVLKVTY